MADSQAVQDKQFLEWGVSVHTSNVRPAHIANGIVQLLRVAAAPPKWSIGPNFAKTYPASVKDALVRPMSLQAPAKALCVTKTKHGPVRLDAPSDEDPAFMSEARNHFQAVMGRQLERNEHEMLASVVNADGKVMASGGDDPTTPGLMLAGFSSTHTLAGMHAATFLGLLSRTADGCDALAKLYALLADDKDSHSSLLSALKLADNGSWPKTLSASHFRDLYPLPSGGGWDELAAATGRVTGNLLSWNRLGISKADTLMGVIDLCALLLMLRLFLWKPSTDTTRDQRLLLMLSPAQVTSYLRQAVARAQESLKLAGAALDNTARAQSLLTKKGTRTEKARARKSDDYYMPSTHASNLGAAGGWLFPLDSRGGAKRYFRPGPRQLMTLVRSLVRPGNEMSWRDFADVAEGLGIAVGGVHEHRTAVRLGLRAATESIRRVGLANREHLVLLGLARKESDNLVIVDGGAS